MMIRLLSTIRFKLMYMSIDIMNWLIIFAIMNMCLVMLIIFKFVFENMLVDQNRVVARYRWSTDGSV